MSRSRTIEYRGRGMSLSFSHTIIFAQCFEIDTCVVTSRNCSTWVTAQPAFTRRPPRGHRATPLPVRKDIRQRAHGPPPRGHGHGVDSQRTQASRRQRAVLCRLNDRIHGTRVRRIRGKRWTAQYSGSVWSPSNSSSVSSCRSSSISSSPSSSCSAVQAESSARSAQ